MFVTLKYLCVKLKERKQLSVVVFLQEHGLDNELMNLALLSSPQDMLDVARLECTQHQLKLSCF